MWVRVPPTALNQNVMAKQLFIDVETYSSVDISDCGAYKYIESKDFEILLIGYAIDSNNVEVIDLASGEEMPQEFLDALYDSSCLKIAHNATFERLCFMRKGYNIPVEQWYCTAVKSAYCGLPLSLDSVSTVLDIYNKKLDTGKALIRYFSQPCKPTIINGMRERNLPQHAPEKWEMYKEYNKYDVLAEREIFDVLAKYEIPQSEREVYFLDQHINDKGIMVDLELAESAVAVNEEYSKILIGQAKRLTGLTNPNSVPQVCKWIEYRTGEEVSSLLKANMPELFSKFADHADVIELLNIRKKLSKTSVKKYYAMISCAMRDQRVRGTFQFYGANRTGRWAGRLLQLQNLSKNHVSNIELPRELIRRRDWDTVDMAYGDVPDILSQLVRTALIAPKGKVFCVADFSAIEARVISWLANEQWRIDVFKGDGKIYEATGSRMFGVPISSITKGSELRDKAKASELAFGYGGARGALLRMGGERMGLSNEEMDALVEKWRNANKSIVSMWAEIENAAKTAIKTKKPVTCTCRNLVMDCDDRFLTIELPSKRKLFYYGAGLGRKVGNKSANSITYYGTVQETKQWGLIDTYGGKLTENIVQAIARDLLAFSMLNLYHDGYTPVCHIHDECIIEADKETAKETYNNMVNTMCQAPSWACDIPLKADGYITPFYMKD